MKTVKFVAIAAFSGVSSALAVYATAFALKYLDAFGVLQISISTSLFALNWILTLLFAYKAIFRISESRKDTLRT
jgi:hypothetical protein